MTNCTLKKLQLTELKKHKVTAQFNGGSITSNAGGMLLREIDNKLGLLSQVAKLFDDKRDQSKVKHSTLTMLRQRVFGIALGYEDLNDHDYLRNDVAMQTMASSDSELASRMLLPNNLFGTFKNK